MKRLAYAAAIALALSFPAIAQDCVTYDQVLASVEDAGGKIVGSARYNGAVTTETLVIETDAAILLFGFGPDNCLVGSIVLEAAKAPEVGA